MEEKKQKGFVVKDRRMFDGTGEVQPEENRRSDDASSTQAGGAGAATGTGEETGDFLGEVNFYNFILSLSTTAMFHFGDFPDPKTKEAEKNLAAAKHTIDILCMLKEKTRGNLEEQEKKLLDGILYELQMRYVRETVRT